MGERMKSSVKWALAITLLLTMPLGARPQNGAPAPDNTKTNQNDRKQSSPTASQQKANASDTDITRQIRSAIMKDKALSTYAHNVKVITQDGKVTLTGPVRSEDERSSVAAKAVAVAGESNVSNELTVAPPKQQNSNPDPTVK
jgi:hyperosmotically inducible periplasmic protein